MIRRQSSRCTWILNTPTPLGGCSTWQRSSIYFNADTRTLVGFTAFQRYVETYLGDYPQPLPATPDVDAVDSAAADADADAALMVHINGGSVLPRVPKWMLLTYNKSATASSVRAVKSGDLPNQTFSVDLAFDEDIRTWWSAATNNTGEWISVDMSGPVTVHALQINFADQDCTLVGQRAAPADRYKYYVEYYSSSKKWVAIPELDVRNNQRDHPHNYVELSTPLLGVEKMRITSTHMPGGSKFSLSGFRAFGVGGGSKPDNVPTSSVIVTREATDKRHVTVSWTAAAAAEFYVVRYGLAGTGKCLCSSIS